MHLPYDVEKTIVWIQMHTATTLMRSVASGAKPMQLICSPSGFGKTTIAKAECQRHGIRFERPEDRVPAMRRALLGTPERTRYKLAIETRPKKVISLVRVLHRCSVLNAALLLFDDPGRVAYDEDACDILKTGFGMQRMVMYETPEITRNELYRQSGHGGFNPFTPPPEFPLPAHLRWLWLANVNYTDPAILEKLGDHFAPLIARGLNPYWVGDDRENDNYALFLYVHHKATEENLLRNMGFPYQVSRQAVNFYLTHANTLIDLCPRRLELIARAFDPKVPQEVRDSELESMAPTTGGDRRPKLKLPAEWVQVPSGVLLWPETPFKKLKTPAAEKPNPDPDPDPPPAARQTLAPEPEPDPPAPASVIDPQPDTSTDTAQVIDTPAPEPQTELPLTVLVTPAPEEPQLTFGQAIRAVYASGDQLTCDHVADVLCRLPLAEWNDDELSELARALEGCSTWQDENIESLAHVFVQYADGPLLFCTGDEVLVWEGPEKGLQIYTWDAVSTMMAPHSEAEARRRDKLRRRRDTQALLSAKLPPKRKLKAVKDRIDQIIELKAAKFNENAQRAIDHIRQMAADDPHFADCTTLDRYINAVVGSLGLSSDTPGEGE